MKYTFVLHICSFPTYRHNYTSPNKYEFRVEHWKIWLARVIFVILYEVSPKIYQYKKVLTWPNCLQMKFIFPQNAVAVIILFLRWVIPDVSSDLKKKIQREERMIDDLIVKQEQLRSQKPHTARHYGHLRRYATLPNKYPSDLNAPNNTEITEIVQNENT